MEKRESSIPQLRIRAYQAADGQALLWTTEGYF